MNPCPTDDEEFDMREHDEATSRLKVAIAAGLLGAAAMYMLDPDKGRRRRAIAHDKASRLLRRAGQLLDAVASDARQRAQGMAVRAQRLTRAGEVPDDDLVLIERVRARLGRVCSHPHAIHVGALAGCVTISGPILAREASRVRAAVRGVRGVVEVDDHLVEHEEAGSISALQGGREPRGRFVPAHWTPALRVAAVVGGGLVALAGLRARGPVGWTLAAAGTAWALRGGAEEPLRQLVAVPQDEPAEEETA